MRKNVYFLFLSLMLLFAQKSRAQTEKLLYSTDFQNWSALTSSTEQTVTKTTDFSNETLTFKLYQVTINPTGYDATRFNYSLVSTGYAQAQKQPNSYMELSPLASVTRVIFQHGATGSNRGYKLWKKSAATGNAWQLLYSNVANPASGQEVEVAINDTDVALKFTNIDDTQNAYMFSLKVYGNYTSTSPQYPLTTSVNIDAAGTVTRSPNSDQYDSGTSVSLQANVNFGYKFLKWVDASTNTDLSTANPYAVTVDAAKNIQAVFQAVNTYSFTVNKAGSQWGEVQLTPAPTNGKYEEGTEVSMKIIPNPVTSFSYWDDNSTVLEKLVTVDGDKTFTATFDEIPFIVGWNFKAADPKASRQADFFSETTNTGLISAYEPTGTPVNWLANSGAFSPSYPNLRFWTAGADFDTKRRYLKAQFSTVNYKNIQVKSMVSANYQAFSVMTLQYSLDDVTYTKVASVDITDVYNSAWKDLNVVLPAEAEGKDKIYLKWIADETSAKLGNPGDNDGSAFTNVFVYADKIVVADTEAPLLVSNVPAEGSSTASITGSVVLTFNEKVKAGTGTITMGGKTMTGTFGSKTASFPYEKLSYGTTYTFTVPAGALTDESGNAFAGVTISFTTAVRSEPTKKLFDAVVAKDGSGEYTSVIDAIAAAPSSRTSPWLIYIKNGTYTGHHNIPSTKPFIHLIGQSLAGVIISDDRLCGDDGDATTPTYNVQDGATMVVNATDCYFENITFENSFGYTKQAGPQALALYTSADRFTTSNCYLRSYQDTYLTSYNNVADRHYLKNTKIEGAVDFIYGGGDVFFDKCTITCVRKDGGYIVAPSHKTGTAWGYVFSNCTVDESQVTGVTTYFGRPWQNSPKTIFINTTLKAKVYATGWYYKMGAIPVIFADYNTMDANGNAVDMSQRISY